MSDGSDELERRVREMEDRDRDREGEPAHEDGDDQRIDRVREALRRHDRQLSDDG